MARKFNLRYILNFLFISLAGVRHFFVDTNGKFRNCVYLCSIYIYRLKYVIVDSSMIAKKGLSLSLINQVVNKVSQSNTFWWPIYSVTALCLWFCIASRYCILCFWNFIGKLEIYGGFFVPSLGFRLYFNAAMAWRTEQTDRTSKTIYPNGL